MAKKSQLSPMMQQYNKIKESHKDHILLFRLGDFYEMFFDDAINISKELGLVLTGRDCGVEERAPMCGIPCHSVDDYIKQLLEKGYKVAICEQLEDPETAKGLVSRDVVRVITPGTISESDMLDDSTNNYICSINRKENDFGICFADISTGVVHATEISSDNLVLDIINEIEKFSPSEILYNMDFVDLTEVGKYINTKMRCTGELIDDEEYDIEMAKKLAFDRFGEAFTKSPISNFPLAMEALGVLLNYLIDTQKDGVLRVVNLNYYSERQFMGLDLSARHSLELVKTMRMGDKKGSLLHTLDRTKTSMGKRFMRKSIEQPLIQKSQILSRQDAVEALLKQPVCRDEIIDILSDVRDLERLMTKVIYNSVNPHDMISLCTTIGTFPSIKRLLSTVENPLLKRLNNKISDLSEIHSLIENAIDFDAPATLKEGGVIKKGFNDELDELRDITKNGRGYITQMETREKKRTGIKSLKIRFNKVFGYYIEVTKTNLDQVPEDYIRKQTLANSERYFTNELKEYEQKILTADERSLALEHEIYSFVRKSVAEYLIPIQSSAEAISILDILCSFAKVSQECNYVRPEIATDGDIIIRDGRHPVVESFSDRPFVPNDTKLDLTSNKMMVITGPNMAGKSTYMRQIALIVIMAQIGCFVPASYAKISIVDKIFTRIGASDDLAAGQSTFMIEMNEMAGILKFATPNSLVILDEVGRGTSTFDGMSIAKAAAEYIIKEKSLGCKTLFATHYHELTSLEEQLPGVVNYNIAVKKRGDEITFLRKIVRGGVDDSYGVAVAKLAGLPDAVIDRANEILKELESEAYSNRVETKDVITDIPINLEIEEPNEYKAIKKLKEISPDTLTPIEAMNILFELQKMVR